MGAGRFRFVKVMTVSLAALLIVAACDDDAATSEDTPEPTPTPTPEQSTDDEITEQPDPGGVPCEVRELETPRENVPEPDPERIDDWLETARTFNDVTIGPDGQPLIASYRHAAVLVPGEDGTLDAVWFEGIRNRHSGIAPLPDGRVALLQDNGVQFIGPDGQHQHAISMSDSDAGWFPEYGGLGVDSEGDLYMGLDRDQYMVKLDEDCNVLGHWPDDSTPVAPLIAVDGNDRIYALDPAPESPTVRVLDQNGAAITEWTLESPADVSLTTAITERPGGGVTVLWIVPDEDRVADPEKRTVADFLVQAFELDGELAGEWYGTDSGSPELLAEPTGMVIDDDGTTHIVDRGVGEDRMRMQTFNAEGEFVDEWRLESDEALCEFGGVTAWMANCGDNGEPESGASPTPQPSGDESARDETAAESLRDVLFKLFDATDAEDYETVYNHLVSDFQRIEFDPDASERRQWVSSVAPRNVLAGLELLSHPPDVPESWRVEEHDTFSVVRHRDLQGIAHVFRQEDGEWRLDPGEIQFVRAFE